jgi:uncharacterized membrane protein
MSEIPPAGSPESTPPNNTPGTPPTPPTPEYATPGVTPPTPDAADVEKNKAMAVLAYLGILVLVPILAAKDSPFAKYHANQGLVLTIGAVALFFAVGILSFIVGAIPGVNVIAGCFGCVLFPTAGIGYLVLVIMGIVNAVNGRMKPLPLFPPMTVIK